MKTKDRIRKLLGKRIPAKAEETSRRITSYQKHLDAQLRLSRLNLN